MDIEYSIKNFRIFDSQGANFNFKPITILTGCNSSGKSSAVKSILLLRNFIELAKRDLRLSGKFRPQDYLLDFTKPELKLGSFDAAINRNSPDAPIVFSYVTSTPSSALSFRVEMSFVKNKEEGFNGGKLDNVKILNAKNGDILIELNVHDGELSIDSLNLNSQILLFFLRFYGYVCYRNTKELADYYGAEGDKKQAEKKNEEAEFILKDLAKVGYPINQEEADRYSIAYEEFNKKESTRSLISNSYYSAVRKALELRVLFYFPLLEQLDAYAKSRVRLAFENIKSRNGNVNRELVDLIVDDFEQSNYNSFLDYYRNLEDQKFSEIIKDINITKDDDLSSLIKKIAEVSPINTNDLRKETIKSINFDQVYSVLCNWQLALNDDDVQYYFRVFEFGNSFSASHILYSSYLTYIIDLITKLLLPAFADELNYIGSSHTTVKRIYSFDDNENNMVKAIEEYISLKGRFKSIQHSEAYKAILRAFPSFRTYKPDSFINRWLKELGLGYSIGVIMDKDGLGAKLILKSEKNDKEGHSLADEGYGVSQVVVLLLYIEIEILRTFFSLFRNDSPSILQSCRQLFQRTLAVEEPEVNLHPSMQSKLACIFNDAFSLFGVNFIIETHSEYLIRKLQTLIAKKEMKKDSVVLYYINNKCAQEDAPVSKEILINECGLMQGTFGHGFFDEADSLSIELLRSGIM